MLAGGKVILQITLFFSTSFSYAQHTKIESLKTQVALATEDSVKVELLLQLGDTYINASKPDSFIIYLQQALALIQKNKYTAAKELSVLGRLDFIANATGNYAMAMNYASRALMLSEQTNDIPAKAFALANIGTNYSGMGDYNKALVYFFRAKKVFETYESGHWAIQNIAETYLKLDKLDSALYYNQKAYHIADTGRNQQYMKAFAIRVFANIYASKGQDELALNHYRQFVADFYNYNLNNREIAHTYFGMAKLYQRSNNSDSSIFYAGKALDCCPGLLLIRNTSSMLLNCFLICMIVLIMKLNLLNISK